MKFKVKAEENKKSNLDRLIEIAESLYWSVEESDGIIELRQYSPAGEDFGFSIDNNDHLGQQIFEYAENFDVDEHIEMWLEGKRNGVGGVPSARELVHDAEEIQNMLDELAKATREIW